MQKTFFSSNDPQQADHQIIETTGNHLDLTAKKEKESKENNEFIEKITSEKNALNAAITSPTDLIPFPKLEISITMSKNNSESEKIILTPNSINNVIKKTNEEKFYFGRQTSKSSGTKINDYNFIDESIASRQFEVTYNKEKSKFFVVDNKKGTGLFVKINNKITIDHDMIVSFCATHMLLQVQKETDGNKIVKIRFLQGPENKKEHSFSSAEKKQIRIGRSKTNEIVYKDDSVSRIQCTLCYENDEWILFDGHFEPTEFKISTNGLWLLASSKVEMTNEMVLKTGNTTLNVKFYEKEQ